VYIFTRSSGSWAQQATVATDGRDERTGFGGSLAVDDEGTTAFIGAFVDGEPNGEKAGAAYVYADEGGSWSQQAKVAADDGDENDQFADSVALSSDGQVALAGAGNDADPNGTAAGSAYVFTPTGDTWEQASKLTADDGDTRDGFGTVLTLASDTGTAVIGALGDEDPNGEGELSGGGSAYVFD